MGNMPTEDFDVGATSVSTIFRAVRLGGEGAWKSNAQAKAQGEKRVLARFPQDPRMRWDDWKQRPGVFEP
jgi:hypothetical protein